MRDRGNDWDATAFGCVVVLTVTFVALVVGGVLGVWIRHG